MRLIATDCDCLQVSFTFEATIASDRAMPETIVGLYEIATSAMADAAVEGAPELSGQLGALLTALFYQASSYEIGSDWDLTTSRRAHMRSDLIGI